MKDIGEKLDNLKVFDKSLSSFIRVSLNLKYILILWIKFHYEENKLLEDLNCIFDNPHCQKLNSVKLDDI